jgi:hypothetical protein
MLKFNDFISEAHRGVDNYSISFIYEDQNYEITSSTMRELFCDVVDWLYERGYDFSNLTFSIDEMKNKIKTTTYRLGHFHDISNSGNVIQIHINNPKLPQYLVSRMEQFLTDFGCEDVKFEGFDIYQKSQKLEVENPEPVEEEPIQIQKPKIYLKNPFKQSICVLGESGAGKSVTIETILENEGHNFEFIIPTAATTGLLAQFSPSKSGYVASRLGRMLIEASKNPDTLYTAVFDEMHKSNVIEMINDELLQAISTKRNRGRRFISLDDDTAEIYQDSELETERGNLLIPDNFGFIFISSKPRVIANNADFFNRVDIVILKSYEEETIETSEQLLSNKLSDEDKMKLASTRND